MRIARWAALLLQAQVAGAQTNAATAETLMRQSGLWNQLAGVAPQVRAGLMASLAQARVNPSASEVERMNELVAVTRSAEAMVQLTIDTTLAAQSGARSAAPDVQGPSPNELRALLDAQKPQMLKAYEGLTLASSAKVYATLPTETLRQYVAFLKSDAGRHFNDVGMRALGAAMVDASAELGRRLPASKDQSNA